MHFSKFSLYNFFFFWECQIICVFDRLNIPRCLWYQLPREMHSYLCYSFPLFLQKVRFIFNCFSKLFYNEWKILLTEYTSCQDYQYSQKFWKRTNKMPKEKLNQFYFSVKLYSLFKCLFVMIIQILFDFFFSKHCWC